MLGKINPPILFLRIMVRHDKLKAAGEHNYDFDDVELARADASRYLQDYVTIEALKDPLRDVYRVTQELKKYPATRAAYDAMIRQRQAREAAARAEAAEKERKRQAFLAREYAIGDTGPAGGLIFYDKGSFTDGWRYLEAAPPGWSGSPKDPEAPWGCPNTNVPDTRPWIGWGQTNTAKIPKQCGEKKTAAGLAASYYVEIDGVVYDDWFLPSMEEMYALGEVKLIKGSGEFTYWSSTQTGWSKKSARKVRPVRFVTPKITPHKQ
jgi:hypothetical protein